MADPAPQGVLYVLATIAVVAVLAFLAVKLAGVIRRGLERREAELMSRRR